MATASTAQVAEAPKGGGRLRSPNFPALSLPDALKKAEAVYDKDGRSPLSAKVILEHWDYGGNVSGTAGRVLSALRQYGLLAEAAEDKYRVSDDAFHTLTLSEDSPVRKQAILRMARKPATFQEVMAAFPERLPSDSALRDFLISEKRFNPDSVGAFIRALKGTVEFAKLYDPAYTKPVKEMADPAVGDFVQWDSQGVLQFETPKRVVHLQDGYVFVEGSGTGIPMDQVQKVEPPPASANPTPPLGWLNPPMVQKPPLVGVAREVSSLSEGEAVLQWPAVISKESVAELEDWLSLVIKKLKRRYAEDGK